MGWTTRRRLGGLATARSSSCQIIWGERESFDYLFGSLNGMVKVRHDYDYYGNSFRQPLYLHIQGWCWLACWLAGGLVE